MAQKLTACWSKKWLIYCTKSGQFIAQKAANLLHKGQAEFLNRKQPLSLCHGPYYGYWATILVMLGPSEH